MTDALAALETDVEVRKLARALGTDAERFGFLAELPAEDVREFREQAAAALFDAHTPTLRRMAAASRLLPVPVLAVMAQKAFGPLLAARMAGLVEPGRGVEIAARLPTPFLADVAAELDPRRAHRIVSGVPSATAVEVTVELERRRDWITLARFVEHVPDRTAEAGVERIADASLLRVAVMLDDKTRADALVARLPRHRKAGIVSAADEHGLWPELFAVLSRLGDEVVEPLADAATELPPEVLSRASTEASRLGVDHTAFRRES